MFVPFGDELLQLRLQVGRRGKVRDPQALPLQNRKPLLALVEPGTVHWCQVQHKPGVRLPPGLDLLAGMCPGVIANEMNGVDLGWNVDSEVLQERDELSLPLAPVALPVDSSCPGIERGQEIQRPGSPILVLHQIRSAGRGWPRGMAAWAWLQRGFLIDAEDQFISRQGPRVQVHHLGHPRTELSISWGVGRQPQMVPPRPQCVVRQETAHRLGRNMLDEAVAYQLAGQLQAVPLGKGAAQLFRSLAGHLDQMDGHGGGKTPAGGRDRLCRPALGAAC